MDPLGLPALDAGLFRSAIVGFEQPYGPVHSAAIEGVSSPDGWPQRGLNRHADTIFPETPTPEEQEQAAADWANALDEMIYAFKCVADEDFDSPVTVVEEQGWTVETDKIKSGSGKASKRLETYGIRVDQEAVIERNRSPLQQCPDDACAVPPC